MLHTTMSVHMIYTDNSKPEEEERKISSARYNKHGDNQSVIIIHPW